MPEYLAPGVYIEETSFRPKTIEGVSTSTAGFVGPARFGPFEGVPELLTSFTDFERTYGGIDKLEFSNNGRISPMDNYLAHAVRAYFENGGKRLYVSRVYSPLVDQDGKHLGDGGYATSSIGQDKIKLAARYPGECGNMTVDFLFKVGQNIVGKEGVKTVLCGASEYDVILLKTKEIDNNLFWLEFNKEKNTYKLRGKNPSEEESLLFRWNKIPEDDSYKLIEFLLRNYKIDWLTKELIEKKTDYSSIIVYDNEHVLSITLDTAKTVATLTFDGQIDTLEAKEENNTVDIYTKKSFFNWDKIPGVDTDKFIEFMKNKFSIDWIKNAEIKDAVANKIEVALDDKKISLELNPGKTELSITIDTNAPVKFDVDSGLNVYETDLLFDWNKIQGNIGEDKKLRKYLKENYTNIDWVNDAFIENSGTIEASAPTGTKSVKLYLNADKTKAFIKITNIQSGEYNTRTINNELNIYKNDLFVTDLLPDDQAKIVTVNVTIDMPGKFSSPSTFENLSFHPDHKKSLKKVFSASPNDRFTELYVPLIIDTIDTKLQNGTAIAEALLEELNINGRKVRSKYASETSKDSDRTLRKVLADGNDGQRPTADFYEGADKPGSERILKSGLKTFEDIEDISIVAAPGSSSDKSHVQTILSHLITHCERMRYRIAVLDSANNQLLSDVRKYRGQLDSKHAALYYPWVTILDPLTNEKLNLPPSGFVAGIYARNDVEYGVHKAPANEVVKLAVGFDIMLNKAQQDVLNPEGINCFRFFEGRGYRLWGARTITSDPEWKYVNLRRYFAYLERSIDKGTQWVVFENNSERLWANVKSTVEDFLFSEWKSGHLMGESTKEAYFVRCDRSTMTQNDIDNGRLVCLIGVAPVRPAEFVIFRIGQKLLDTKA